jgi:hypothetical protein
MKSSQFHTRYKEAFTMNHIKILCCCIFLFAAGCMQAIHMQTLTRTNSIPDVNYAVYAFSTGEGERFRVAFLKSPESDVEVVALSRKMGQARGTFEDAMRFVQSGAGYRDVDVQSVTYNGKIIGYLLTQSAVSGLQRQRLAVDVYERGGKIYFWADEILDDTMD